MSSNPPRASKGTESANAEMSSAEGACLFDPKYIRHDLRQVLLHECGHLFVARHFGGDGHIELTINRTFTPQSERTVTGQTRYRNLATAPVSRAAFGAAGVVAETLGDEPDQGAYSITEFIELGVLEPSETDWAAIGNHLEEGVTLATEILLSHWQEFEQTVADQRRVWTPLIPREVSALPSGGVLHV